MKWLEQIKEFYEIRSRISLAVNCEPKNRPIKGIEERVLSKMWEDSQVWDKLPSGVGRVSFENGIELTRPETTDEANAMWRLSDINVYFAREYKNKIKLVEWEPIVPRLKKNPNTRSNKVK